MFTGRGTIPILTFTTVITGFRGTRTTSTLLLRPVSTSFSTRVEDGWHQKSLSGLQLGENILYAKTIVTFSSEFFEGFDGTELLIGSAIAFGIGIDHTIFAVVYSGVLVGCW